MDIDLQLETNPQTPYSSALSVEAHVRSEVVPIILQSGHIFQHRVPRSVLF